jgi:hypothetical protein
MRTARRVSWTSWHARFYRWPDVACAPQGSALLSPVQVSKRIAGDAYLRSRENWPLKAPQYLYTCTAPRNLVEGGHADSVPPARSLRTTTGGASQRPAPSSWSLSFPASRRSLRSIRNRARLRRTACDRSPPKAHSCAGVSWQLAPTHKGAGVCRVVIPSTRTRRRVKCDIGPH